jgi:hypothetical protein
MTFIPANSFWTTARNSFPSDDSLTALHCCTVRPFQSDQICRDSCTRTPNLGIVTSLGRQRYCWNHESKMTSPHGNQEGVSTSRDSCLTFIIIAKHGVEVLVKICFFQCSTN